MSWVTPLGLPAIQPYRQPNIFLVKTLLQSITLAEHSDQLPVSMTKQRSAFPPNYVHSLDSTHMLITSLKMRDRGLDFASVHDSYWTHAADVPVMGEVGRTVANQLVCAYSVPSLAAYPAHPRVVCGAVRAALVGGLIRQSESALSGGGVSGGTRAGNV